MKFTTVVLILSSIVATAHVSAVATGLLSNSGGGGGHGGERGGSGDGSGNRDRDSGVNNSGFSKRHLVVPENNLHNLLRRPAGIVDQRLKAIWNSYHQETDSTVETTTGRSLQQQAVREAVDEFRAQLVRQVQEFVDARAVTARDVSQDIQDIVDQYVDTAVESVLQSSFEAEAEERTYLHASEPALRARVLIWLDGLDRALFAQVWETLAQRGLVRLRSHAHHDYKDHVEDHVSSVYKD
ncbi:hypothetical protein CPB97_002294 [Podila verticillata]|nr:hypothetical protein CPB97_002294 [Podila verticillata]